MHACTLLTFGYAAGLHDPRVGYWEPMKYAQVLRDAGAQDVLCKVLLLRHVHFLIASFHVSHFLQSD